MLSTAEIKRFIDDDINSDRKRLAAVGERYYNGEHDILKSRLFYFNADGKLVEDTTRSNVKICHPFFTELADQLAAFMLSFDESPIRAKEGVTDLQERLDLYFDDEFWAEVGELITGAYSKGFDYIYAYKNADERLSFQYADSMGVVEVREQDTDDGCKYVIYWYVDRIEKGKKEVRRIQVWSETDTAYYVQVGNGKIIPDESEKVNPRPHVVFIKKDGTKMGYPLGYIPFWRLDNNKKRVSGLKPIKGLIDDYDLMQCGLSNNLVDFDTPLHVVRGFHGTDLSELQQNLKTKKIVGVDAEGGVETQTVDIPFEARQAKAKEDEKNIFRFGMGLDMNALKDTSATTNLAIQAAYSLLEMKANKMKPRLQRLLKDILKVVLAEINAAMKTDYQISDISFSFKWNIKVNETENIQNEKTRAETRQIEVNTILNVAANVGDEQTLQAICDVMEWDFDAIQSALKKQAEESLAGAQGALDAVVPEDDPAFPVE